MSIGDSLLNAASYRIVSLSEKKNCCESEPKKFIVVSTFQSVKYNDFNNKSLLINSTILFSNNQQLYNINTANR